MIEGEKVLICGLSKESSIKILKWVNDPELKQYTGTIFPVSEFEHENWIRNRAESKTDKLFLIKEKKSNIDIGTIGLKNIDYINSNAEIYISIGNNEFLSQNHSGGGKGYGTDAVLTFSNFCFDRLNLHKVYLKVFESNKRAIRCYEKAGFKIEGRLIEHHFTNGRYNDVFVMGKTR